LSPLFAIFISEGVTALSMKTIKENWSSDYQKTNDAGIPEPDGSVTWNFK
jgi:potassium/chloride transporter 4/5/6